LIYELETYSSQLECFSIPQPFENDHPGVRDSDAHTGQQRLYLQLRSCLGTSLDLVVDQTGKKRI
jgi:hypothetical protein